MDAAAAEGPVGRNAAAGMDVTLKRGDSELLVQQNRLRLERRDWEEYRRPVLPPLLGIRLALETDATQRGRRYIGDLGDVIGLDPCGASASGPVLMREYGFTVKNICKQALARIEKKNV